MRGKGCGAKREWTRDDKGRQLLPIDYLSPRPIVTTGNSRVVRCAAGFASLGLLVLIAYIFWQSRHIREWILAIAAAGGGACYCLLIALDIAGRKRTDILRRVK